MIGVPGRKVCVNMERRVKRWLCALLAAAVLGGVLPGYAEEVKHASAAEIVCGQEA